jgi:hypothetical protein
MSYPHPKIGIVIPFLLLLLTHSLFAGEPEENTIPILAIRAASGADFSKVSLLLLCELSWKHFDGVDVGGPVVDGSVDPEMSWAENREFMEHCSRVGLLLSLAPWELCQYYNPWNENTAHWFRWTGQDLDSDSCFGQVNFDMDALVAVMSAEDMADTTTANSLASTVKDVASVMDTIPALWFYNIYDEAGGWQRRRMLASGLSWSRFIPNVFTQERDSITNMPSLAEVEPSGIFSWTKWLAEHDSECSVPTTTNLVLIHSIGDDEYSDWGGNSDCDFCHGTLEQHADMVSAVCETMYQRPQVGGIPRPPVDNSPGFISYDDYPFRYVDMDFSGSTTICDDDWLFLIDHYEEAMDTTVITAKEYGIPVHLYIQTFGAAGGDRLFDDSTGLLHYPNFLWRTPTPAEVRMYAGLALLHQVKGIHPYSLASYLEQDKEGFISSSLLDMNSIPFDAPYEDWVYTGRIPPGHEGMEYADPRYLPPFSEGFDPLYELPDPPDLAPDCPRNKETWATWFFEPYGRLYREIGDILGEVAVIAPEMADLWWWEGSWDVASIVSVEDPGIYDHYVPPAIRVFQGPDSSSVHLYYVNRYLRNEETDYTISIVASESPGQLYPRVLDHSRRFLVPSPSRGEGNNVFFAFDDTLEAGEGRLVEFVDTNVPADIRVTSPDAFAIREDSTERTDRFVCTAGETITLGAVFYNMGTDSTGNIGVVFEKAEGPTILGTDTISFDGLSGSYSPDSVSASIQWETDAGDAGVHRVKISAGSVQGENTSDNSVTVTVLVEPVDYATEVLGNAWDMTEALSNPPDWFTPDIVSVGACWDDSCWTDSVSGMFEGVLWDDNFGDWSGFRGDIFLHEDEQEPIDADIYTWISMAGVSVNPNESGEEFGCGMFLFWKDSVEANHVFALHEAEGFGEGFGNGPDMWRVFGPFDLAGVDGWGGEIHDLRIRFQMDYPDPMPIEIEPILIRLGWVKLTEGAI